MDPLRVGQSKDQGFQKTGIVVGVADASFTANGGEIFVLIGLPGSGKSTQRQILLGGQGVAALRHEVLASIQRLDIGLVFVSGLAVVLLAIMLDRIAETFGSGRPRRSLRAKLGIDGRASEVDKA